MARRAANPYIAGMPLIGETGFYGRGDLFDFVRETLTSSPQRVIVLFGQRRIGKTSILHQLPRHLPVGFHAVYFDLQGRARQSLDQVLYDLALAIAQSLSFSDLDPSEFEGNVRHFREGFLPQAYAVSDQLIAAPHPCTLVFLFDEFDVLGDEPRVEDAAADTFFPYLQQLIADEQRLAFVFVIGRRIEELPTYFQSVFKTAHFERISRLKREEAVRLIVEPAKDVMEYEKAAVDHILSLTASHPYFTQLLCSELFRHLRRQGTNRVRVDDVEAVVDRAIERGTAGLTWFWEGLPRAERFILAAVAHATSGTGAMTREEIRDALQHHRVRLLGMELTSAPDVLVKWEILRHEDPDGYRFVVELVRRWILKKHSLEEAKRELDLVSPRATHLYEAARSAHMDGELEAAIHDYRRALAVNPNHARAQLGLAQALYEKGERGEAVVEYERAYGLDEVSARDGLVAVRMALAREQQRRQEYDGTIASYERILQLLPDDEEARTRLAEVHRQAEKRRYLFAAKKFFSKVAENLLGAVTLYSTAIALVAFFVLFGIQSFLLAGFTRGLLRLVLVFIPSVLLFSVLGALLATELSEEVGSDQAGEAGRILGGLAGMLCVALWVILTEPPLDSLESNYLLSTYTLVATFLSITVGLIIFAVRAGAGFLTRLVFKRFALGFYAVYVLLYGAVVIFVLVYGLLKLYPIPEWMTLSISLSP